MNPSDTRNFFLGFAAFAILVGSWGYALFLAPSEANQGEIYRIIFFHVPSAFCAFASAFALCIGSLWSFYKTEERVLHFCRAMCEVGLIFTALTLMSGSIWGRPTWGVWWTWDARLTTTLLLAILYAGYLILHSSMGQGAQRIRACAVLGVVIAVNVPIIYKSVDWWRTLHQPPSIIREGGSTMSPAILATLLTCLATLAIAGTWLVLVRQKNLAIRDVIESKSYAQLQS